MTAPRYNTALGPVVVMQNHDGPHEVLFHFMRDDVVLGSVYWDAADAGPARTTGWFFVANGSLDHFELGPIPRSNHARAVRAGYEYLLDAPEFALDCSPAESRELLFWCWLDEEGNRIPPTLELTVFDVDLNDGDSAVYLSTLLMSAPAPGVKASIGAGGPVVVHTDDDGWRLVVRDKPYSSGRTGLVDALRQLAIDDRSLAEDAFGVVLNCGGWEDEYTEIHGEDALDLDEWLERIEYGGTTMVDLEGNLIMTSGAEATRGLSDSSPADDAPA